MRARASARGERHFHRVFDGADGLVFECFGAAVPEESGAAGGVHHARRVARTQRAADALADDEVIREGVLEVCGRRRS